MSTMFENAPDDGDDRKNENNFEVLENTTETEFLSVLLADHDRRAADLFNEVTGLYGRPEYIEKTTPKLNFKVQKVETAFKLVVDNLKNDLGWESAEFKNSVAALILDEEHRRKKIFEDVDPEADIDPLDRERYESLLDQITEGSEIEVSEHNISYHLSGLYRGLLANDINNFLMSVRGQEPQFESDDDEKESVKDRIRRVLPELGRQGLDAAKIALGVAAGMVAASYINGKKK